MTNDRGLTPKEKTRRCALAKCPLAGKRDRRCAQCTGPVSWTDADGKRRGAGADGGAATRRACHNCPMDGLGLPVCWAGCDGPRQDFTTDGQSMVTLGGMPDAERYIGARMSTEAILSRRTASASGGGRGILKFAASRLLTMDTGEWRKFTEAKARRDVREMSRLSGIPKSAFSAKSEVGRLVDMLAGIPSDDWQTLRHVVLGRSQSSVARISSRITKQAVSQRLHRAALRYVWVARLLYGGGTASQRQNQLTECVNIKWATGKIRKTENKQ